MALFVPWQGITKYRGDFTLWHQIFKFARIFKAKERYVRSAVRKITSAGFFDAHWYLGQNPDVVQANINPLQHYVRYGAAEGRRPCPNFDPQWYLQQNPDVARAGVEPLSHYLTHGWREGRDPTPLFRSAWYLQKNPDVAAAGIEPLTHYMSSGWREGRDPSLFFQSAWYLAQNIDVNHAGVEPLTHYLSSGWREGRSPNRLFKPTWYLEQNPDVAQANTEPLGHYLSGGCREGRIPSPVLARALVARGFRPNAKVSRDDVESVFDFMFKNPDVFESELWQTREGHDVTDLHYEILRCGNDYVGKDVCIFACYCPDGQLPASAKILLDWIKRSGVSVLCVVATEKSGSVAGFDDDLAIIVRDNAGYDFAAWALALRVIPSLWAARSLLFANDSVYGPIDSDNNNLITMMLAAPADCVALTVSKEVALHFQSYFFIFKNQAMASRAVRQFWSSVRVLRDQTRLIHEYEISLFSTLFGAGLACQALFGSMSDKTVAANPTLHHWRALIAADFPFIKKRVITDDIAGVDNSGWVDAIQNRDLQLAVSDEQATSVEIPATSACVK